MRPNLLLLTIDAWRHDFVDSFEGIALTPTLDSLSHQALRFDQAYTSGPWTTPGIVSILTGEDAVAHGIWYPWSIPRRKSSALAIQLAESGYRVETVCYKTPGPNYLNLGFKDDCAPRRSLNPEDSLLLDTLQQLSVNKSCSPWFAWYHYRHVHLPYWPSRRYREALGIVDHAISPRLRNSICRLPLLPQGDFLFHPEERRMIQRLYAAGVRCLDDFLARVVTALEETGQRDHTIILITSDHGDEHLEHGHVGHASTACQATLFQEVLRIPLVIIHPGIRGPQSSSQRVQLQDLMPTMLALAGVRDPQGMAGSRDLSPLVRQAMEGIPSASLRAPSGWPAERALRFHSSRMGFQTSLRHSEEFITGFLEGELKYIYERYEHDRCLLFDLGSDPMEQRPILNRSAIESAHDRLLELCPELGIPRVAPQAGRV